jgi:ATP-dependent Clp protease ATP-binding subunit ClpA
VVVRAQEECRDLRHRHIGTEHLLLALLKEDGGIASGVLRGAGVRRDRVRADVDRLLGRPQKILTDADADALRTIGIDLDAVLARIEEAYGPAALDAPCKPARRGLFRRRRVRNHIPFTPRAKKVLELSLREALHLGHSYIGTEHILLGLIREGNGLAAQILTEAGVDLADLRREVLAALGKAA